MLNPLNAQYYTDLSTALKGANAMRPTLVIDKAHLDQNITLVNRIIERGFNFRLVAKSLPCLPLIQYILEKTNSNRIMSFHLPFLMQAAYSLPDSDILLGKPMPVAGVEHFYSQIDQLDSTFNPDTQVHWLIDSTVRLQQYAELAQRLDRPMQINLEIDIGLHRGGYEDMSAFITSLEIIRDASHLTLTGLMGYEAYICKIPSFLGGAKKAFSNAQNKYQEFTQQVKQTLSLDNLDHLILNTGGSSTYPLYEDNKIANELACASALVKPTDFDVFTLDDHLPAAFIATPVLKVVDQPNLPMASGLSRFLRKLNLSPQSSCFIYGGNWLASPCHPANAKVSSILGHSSNQEMYDLPNNCPLKQDDFMFFRPSQSEAVLLQFGKIAIYDQGKITHWWDVFSNS